MDDTMESNKPWKILGIISLNESLADFLCKGSDGEFFCLFVCLGFFLDGKFLSFAGNIILLTYLRLC